MTNIFQLPTALDLTAADALKQDLLAALAVGPVEIDASAVSRVSSPCLQILAAAAQDGTVRITGLSEAFAQGAQSLGLQAVLGLS